MTRFACIPELRSLRNVLVCFLVAAAAVLPCGRAPFAAHAAAGPAQVAPQQESPLYLPVIRSNYVQYSVDVGNRQAARDFFYAHYVGSGEPPIEWTGDHANCSAGDTSTAFQAHILERINYFRAMAGVPAEVVLLDDFNRKAQAAALLMSVNGELSHAPPATWTCYSQEAYDGASASNLGLGSLGAEGIQSFMQDWGANNYGVGHRRWMLLPQTRWMGAGNVPGRDGYSPAYALFVVDQEHYFDPRPPVRDFFIAWPPAGYTPYQVVFPRWSFSYPDADFTSAAVTMLADGAAIPVTLESLRGGGAGDPTIVWRPLDMEDHRTWPEPDHDTNYTVTASGFLVDGQPQTVTYNVIVFDPQQS